MTKEELEKATGQELIEQRDYCGVDGYYGVYLDNVNEEMLKRFNRLAELEDKIADIKANCDLAIEGRDVKIKELEQELTVEKDQHQEEVNLHLHSEDYIKSLEKENAELREKREQDCDSSWYEGFNCSEKERLKQLTKAKEIIKRLLSCCRNYPQKNADKMEQAEQFLKEIEK